MLKYKKSPKETCAELLNSELTPKGFSSSLPSIFQWFQSMSHLSDKMDLIPYNYNDTESPLDLSVYLESFKVND